MQVVFAGLKQAILEPAVLFPLIFVGLIYTAIQILNYAAYWGISSYLADLDTETRADVFN